MDRLIIPLDGSQFAESVLGAGAQLADRLSTPLDLVHVIGPTSPDDQPFTRSIDEARQYLKRLASRYSTLIDVRIHVMQGHPVDELLRFFHAADSPIVVMSRFGRSGLRRTFSAGIADSLVHGSNVPILLIDSTHPDTTIDLDELLVPLDGSEIANLALPLAVDIAGRYGRLCLIRAVQPPDERARSTPIAPSAFRDREHVNDIAAAAIDEARNFLFQTAIRLRRLGTNVSWEIRFGDPSSEILRASATAGSGLIVIATHGWGGARRWAYGSVTDAVIRGGTTPVLVVPPSRDWLSQHPLPGDARSEAT